MERIAIIGGTGLETLPSAVLGPPEMVTTSAGVAVVREGFFDSQPVFFLSRHGEDHAALPHEINHRANILALWQKGVTRVLATNAAGSLFEELQPESLVILSDFIDASRHVESSLVRTLGLPAEESHTDFSYPYCPALRGILLAAAEGIAAKVRPDGVYLCTNGPRFETPAEVRLFASWGADLVGMTGLPEAVFAREAGICYAGIGIVTNLAAGLRTETVSHEAHVRLMERMRPTVLALLCQALRELRDAPDGCTVCRKQRAS